jgi:hypothetical protein
LGSVLLGPRNQNFLSIPVPNVKRDVSLRNLSPARPFDPVSLVSGKKVELKSNKPDHMGPYTRPASHMSIDNNFKTKRPRYGITPMFQSVYIPICHVPSSKGYLLHPCPHVSIRLYSYLPSWHLTLTGNDFLLYPSLHLCSIMVDFVPDLSAAANMQQKEKEN